MLEPEIQTNNRKDELRQGKNVDLSGSYEITVRNVKGIMSNSSVQKCSYTCSSQPVADNTPLTLKI